MGGTVDREPLWVAKVCEMPDGGRWFSVNSSGWMNREHAQGLVDYLGYLLTVLVDDTEASE